jgi:hypothetical protein
MSTQTNTDEKTERATMTLRFLELPDALAPLVESTGRRRCRSARRTDTSPTRRTAA